MMVETRLTAGSPVFAGGRTLISIARITTMLSGAGIMCFVQPLALIIEEQGALFFSPIQEGVTWEQVRPAFE